MLENGPAVWFFAHLDTSIGIPCKQGPDERLPVDRKYSEGCVIQIFCHLFVTAALSTPRLDRSTVVFFQIQDPKKHCPSVPSHVLQFSVCPCRQEAFLLMFF